MASAFKFHLIDEEGRPLDDHIVNAIVSLEGKIIRQFGQVCDPAVLSDKIEAAATKTARHERKNGRVDDVKSFLWKSLRNLVISEIRGKPKEKAVDSATLERWAGPAREAGPEQIYNHVLARETFEAMPKRDQQIYWLSCQGISAREIGVAFGMSEQNVWTTLCRLRKATQKALLHNGIRSSE
jgi:DNA-directed RNA polymerase specialized sigma24 family protein